MDILLYMTEGMTVMCQQQYLLCCHCRMWKEMFGCFLFSVFVLSSDYAQYTCDGSVCIFIQLSNLFIKVFLFILMTHEIFLGSVLWTDSDFIASRDLQCCMLWKGRIHLETNVERGDICFANWFQSLGKYENLFDQDSGSVPYTSHTLTAHMNWKYHPFVFKGLRGFLG